MLLKTVRSSRLDPNKLITHHFRLDDIMNAYETFGHAADTHALKVIIEANGRSGFTPSRNGQYTQSVAALNAWLERSSSDEFRLVHCRASAWRLVPQT
jgi:hypothetical protein